MGKTIEFAIVIPLYNKGKYIKSTLESVFAQTYPNYEIIIVNDGSTDDSLNYLAEFNDPRLHIYSKENGGVSSARNYGIEKATKEYIAFLDADDLWHKDYLNEICRLIKKYPSCGMFSTGWYYKRNELLKENNSGLTGDTIVENYFKHSLRYAVVWTSATVIKRDILLSVGSFPLGMVSGQDLYTWVKVASVCKLAYSDKKMAYYVIDATSLHFRSKALKTSKCHYSDLIEENNDDKNRYLAKLAYRRAVGCLRNGYNNLAKEETEKFNSAIVPKKLKYKYICFLIIPSPILRWSYNFGIAIKNIGRKSGINL